MARYIGKQAGASASIPRKDEYENSSGHDNQIAGWNDPVLMSARNHGVDNLSMETHAGSKRPTGDFLLATYNPPSGRDHL